jgi:hypothetical protein
MISLALDFEEHANNSFLHVIFMFSPSPLTLNG